MTTTEQFPCMPALKSLGDLADARPVVVVDTREQAPLVFSRLSSVRGTLATGDYSLAGGENLFAIERKSVADLGSCCAGERGRFERELHRLRGFRFKRLVIVGTEDDIRNGRYRSQIKPTSVVGTLAAFEVRYDVPIVYRPDPSSAARQVEDWCWWFSREIVQICNDLLRASNKIDLGCHTPGAAVPH